MKFHLIFSSTQGKLNSLIGVGEALTPLVFAPMYTQMYRATLRYFPGAFFLLGGALTFPAVIIFMCVDICIIFFKLFIFNLQSYSQVDVQDAPARSTATGAGETCGKL